MKDFRTTQKIERLSSLDASSIAKFEREGVRQGQRELPHANETDLSKFEREVLSEHRGLLNELEKEISDFQKNAQQTTSKLRRELDSIIPEKERDILSRTEANVERVEAELGPNSAAFEDNSTKLAETISDVKITKRSLNNRELQVSLVSSYIPFMAALAFAEVWVNSMAFELFFESTPIVSYFLAMAVGAMLVFFAHITGTSVKRALPEEAKPNRLRVTISMLMLNSLVVIFIFYLAKMRQAFVLLGQSQELELVGGLDGDDLGELSDVVGDLANSSVDSLLAANIGEEGFFLLLVNIVVYVCGLVAAMLRHDTHPDYEKLVTRQKKLAMKEITFKKKFELRTASITKNKNDTLNDLANKRASAESELILIDEAIAECDEILLSSRKDVSRSLKMKVKAFREGNKGARKTKAPSYFKTAVVLE